MAEKIDKDYDLALAALNNLAQHYTLATKDNDEMQLQLAVIALLANAPATAMASYQLIYSRSKSIKLKRKVLKALNKIKN